MSCPPANAPSCIDVNRTGSAGDRRGMASTASSERRRAIFLNQPAIYALVCLRPRPRCRRKSQRRKPRPANRKATPRPSPKLPANRRCQTLTPPLLGRHPRRLRQVRPRPQRMRRSRRPRLQETVRRRRPSTTYRFLEPGPTTAPHPLGPRPHLPEPPRVAAKQRRRQRLAPAICRQLRARPWRRFSVRWAGFPSLALPSTSWARTQTD